MDEEDSREGVHFFVDLDIDEAFLVGLKTLLEVLRLSTSSSSLSS